MVPARVSRSRCRYPLRRVDPVRAAGAVLGAAHAVGLRGQQRVDERAEQLAHQIRAGLGQLLVQEQLRVDTGFAVIVVSFFESVVRDHSKDHSGDRTYISRTRSPGSSYTNAMDSTSAGAGRPRLSPRRDVWANEGSGRHYYALLVDSALALSRVLHDPAAAVVDVPDLATDRRRGVVADDVARLALARAELVEREPDSELSHQRAGPYPVVGSAQPGASRGPSLGASRNRACHHRPHLRSQEPLSERRHWPAFSRRRHRDRLTAHTERPDLPGALGLVD